MRRRGYHPAGSGRPPLSVRCPAGKTGFKKGEAERRLAEYTAGGRDRVPCRIYECQHCGYWHLTSRTP